MKGKGQLLQDKDKTLRQMLVNSQWGIFFGISQEIFDQVFGRLTAADGNSAIYISMEIGADRDVFHPVMDQLKDLKITGSTNPSLDYFVKKFLNGPSKIPNYGGGLGILAGDTLKSFADNRLPVAAISLLYRKGYFSQLVDSTLGQIAWTREWHPEETPTLYLLRAPDRQDQPLSIQVPFFDRKDQQIYATARVWVKLEISNTLDYFVPEFLLDFSIPETPEWIRNAATNLYDSSSERAKAIQRRLLGAGVPVLMKAMGITSRTIHLNEQHGVVLVLHLIAVELQEKLGDDYTILASDADIMAAAEKISKRVVYTIHTPVKAGHDRFEKNMYAEIGHSFCQRVLHLLAQDEEYPAFFNFTSLAMKVNRATNSVSRLHKLVTQRQFPQFADKITAITNGVHHLTWISDARAELYNGFPELDNWQNDPGVFANARLLLRNQKFRTYLWEAWARDSKIFIDYVNQMLVTHRKQMQETWIDPPNFLSHLREGEDASLRPDTYTISFARRFSTYKRAALIFENIDRLADILLTRNMSINFIFAGKAHPADEPGKILIKQILGTQKELYEKTKGLAKLVFIPDYDMAVAKMMVAGSHAWLNSPKRPLEASGTSGMKAAMNGVPNISIMDGWWVEGYHDGQAGWKFGYEESVEQSCFSEDSNTLLYAEDSASFYELLPDILDSFYLPERRDEYIDKSIMNLVLNCPIFNTHRMTAEYLQRYRLTLPADTARQMDAFAALYSSDTFQDS